MRLDRQTVLVYGSNVGLSILGFLSTIYFARHPAIGASGLGIYFLFEAVLNVFGVFSTVGLVSGVEQRISSSASDEGGAYLTAAFLVAALPFSIIAVGAFVSQSYLQSYIGAPVVTVLVVTLAFYTASQFLQATLRAEGSIAAASGLQLAGETVRVGLAVALVLVGFGPIGLIFGAAAGQIIRSGFTAVLVDTTPTTPSRETLRDLLEFSKYTAGIRVSDLAYGWLDTLVLGLFLGPTVVGVYEAAWRIAGVVGLTGRSIATVLFPSVSRWFEEDAIEEISNAFTVSTTYSLLPIIPAVVGALLLGDSFLSIVYRFDFGATILSMLMVGKVFESVNLISQRSLLGLDQPSLVFRVTMATLTANLVLNVVLVEAFGGVGAAVATVTTVAIASTIHTRYLVGFVQVGFDLEVLLWQVGASVGMGLVVLGASQILPPTAVLRLALLVGLGTIVYSIAVLGHQRIRSRILSLVGVPT